MEFSRQGHWSGEPFPSPGDHPKSGIKPRSPALQVDSLPAEPPGKPILIKNNINHLNLICRHLRTMQIGMSRNKKLNGEEKCVHICSFVKVH